MLVDNAIMNFRPMAFLLVAIAALLLPGADAASSCFFWFGCELSATAQMLGPIQTKFYLFTRENKNDRQTLAASDISSATKVFSRFKVRNTQVLVHGTLDDTDLTGYMMEIKDELLKHGDYNVIVVDYYSAFFPFVRTLTDYTREVGGQISDLIKELIKSTKITANHFHIIGHSLGGHVAGEAGERVPGIYRVTGLDPGSPYEFNVADDRLDETDAQFVDVIHTDMKTYGVVGIGIESPAGHVDFYVNGGYSQPGCIRSPLETALTVDARKIYFETTICSHMRALRYFNESINSACQFKSQPCDSEADFTASRCNSCGSQGCGYMGFYADKNIPPKGQRVKYYLKTNAAAPFCKT